MNISSLPTGMPTVILIAVGGLMFGAFSGASSYADSRAIDAQRADRIEKIGLLHDVTVNSAPDDLTEYGTWVLDGTPKRCKALSSDRLKCAADLGPDAVDHGAAVDAVDRDVAVDLLRAADRGDVSFDHAPGVSADDLSHFDDGWVIDGRGRECRLVPDYAVECVGDLYLVG